MTLLGILPMMTFAKEGKIKYNKVIYKGNVENGEPQGYGQLYYKGEERPFLVGNFNGMEVIPERFDFGLSFKGKMKISPIMDKSSEFLMNFILISGKIENLDDGTLLGELKFSSYGSPEFPKYDLYPTSIHLVRKDDTKKESFFFQGYVKSQTDISIKIDSIIGEKNGGYKVLPKGYDMWEIRYTDGNTLMAYRIDGENKIYSFNIETSEYRADADIVLEEKISSENIAIKGFGSCKEPNSEESNSYGIPEYTLIHGDVEFSDGTIFKGNFAFVGDAIGFVTGVETTETNDVQNNGNITTEQIQWKDGKNLTESIKNGGTAIIESYIVKGDELKKNSSMIYEDIYRNSSWRKDGFRTYSGPITTEFVDYEEYEKKPGRIKPGLEFSGWKNEVYRMTGEMPRSLGNKVVDDDSPNLPTIMKGKILDKNGEFDGYFTEDGKYAYGKYVFKDGRIEEWQNMINLTEEKRLSDEREKKLQLQKEQELKELKKTIIGQTYAGSGWGPMGTNTTTFHFKFLDSKKVRVTSRFIYLLEPQNEIQRQILKEQQKRYNHDYTLNYKYENGKVTFGPNNDVIIFSDRDHATFEELKLERVR